MKSLYFLALIPPEPIVTEVKQFKLHVQERYQSSRALRSPAHITLVPPFHADDSLAKQVIHTVETFALRCDPFGIQLDGFGCFTQNVIFVKPLESEQLSLLRGRLLSALSPCGISASPKFHPHITIGFRDLTMSAFKRAWEDFATREYRRAFEVEAISLLLNGDDGWTVLQQFSMGD